MSREQARATWKAILRNHPFFREGGMFGFDWNTFHVCYPNDANTLRAAVREAR